MRDAAPTPDPFTAMPSGHELKRRSVRGSVVAILSQAFRGALSLGAMALLARLLTPEDFGLIAMIYAIVTFAEVCMDLGLGVATIQAPHATHAQASTLFWLNLALSALMAVLLVIASPAISRLYREPRLIAVTLVLGSGFLIAGLGMQHRALLTRQMRFTSLAAIDLTALAISLVGAIAAAASGLSYWSLVIRHFLFITATTSGAWLLSGWRPALPSRSAGVASMVAFGANLTGFNLVHYLTRNLDRVLLGWRSSPRQVGLYDNVCHLTLFPVMQFNGPLSRVAIPTLAKLQHDPERYRRYYRTGVLFLTSIGMPFVAFLFAAADDVIAFLLGPQWTDAAGILRAAAPAAFFTTFNVATGWVYTSLGRTDRQLRWGIVTSAATVLTFVIALPFGAIGVAAGLSIVTCLLTIGPPGIAYCYRYSPLDARDFFAAVWRPATASIAAAAALLAVSPLLPTMPLFPRVLLESAAYAVCYAVLWWALPNGRRLFRELLQLTDQLRPASSPPSSVTDAKTPVPSLCPRPIAAPLLPSRPLVGIIETQTNRPLGTCPQEPSRLIDFRAEIALATGFGLDEELAALRAHEGDACGLRNDGLPGARQLVLTACYLAIRFPELRSLSNILLLRKIEIILRAMYHARTGLPRIWGAQS